MDNDGILRYLFHARQSQYTTIAALTLVVHDHFFTCRQEYKFIWIRKWSISKVLFFLSRYGTLAVLILDLYVQSNGGPSNTFCADWFCFQSWTGFASTLVIELVLLFRLYAMYHGSRRLTYMLIALFVCQIGAMAFVLAQGCRAITATNEPLPGVQSCMALTTLSYEYAYWIANLAFDILLFFLAARKSLENIKEYNHSIDDLINSRRVAQVLIRDGIMYFPFIFLTYVVNLVLWALSPSYLGQVADHSALALRSVLTNRLLLNVSRKFYYPQNGITRQAEETVLGFVAWATPPERVHVRSAVVREPEEDGVYEERGKGKRRAEGPAADSDEEGLVPVGGGGEERPTSFPTSAGSSGASARLDPLGVAMEYGVAL